MRKVQVQFNDKPWIEVESLDEAFGVIREVHPDFVYSEIKGSLLVWTSPAHKTAWSAQCASTYAVLVFV